MKAKWSSLERNGWELINNKKEFIVKSRVKSYSFKKLKEALEFWNEKSK